MSARSESSPSADRLDAALRAVFEAQAQARTRAEDEALFDAARRAGELAPALGAERRRLEAALGFGFPVAA
jgi:hypothetical protein